jgi:hypothetical protein
MPPVALANLQSNIQSNMQSSMQSNMQSSMQSNIQSSMLANMTTVVVISVTALSLPWFRHIDIYKDISSSSFFEMRILYS